VTEVTKSGGNSSILRERNKTGVAQ